MRVGGVLGPSRRPSPLLPWPAQLNKAFQAEESPGVIYCISMQWFREWEAFVKGKDNGEWSTGLALRPTAGRALGLQICGEGPRRRERGVPGVVGGCPAGLGERPPPGGAKSTGCYASPVRWGRCPHRAT